MPKQMPAFKAPLLPQAPSVAALNANLQSNIAQARALGANTNTGGGSILTRVFDVLSRGDYAVMNSIKRGLEVEHGLNGQTAHGGFSPQVLGAMGSGFIRGLTGKDKTYGSTALQTLSEANPGNPLFKNRVFQGLGGLAMDIAGDPVSYLSLGAEKALTPLELAGRAAKAIEGVQKASDLAANAGTLSTAVRTAQTAGAPARSRLLVNFAGRNVMPNRLGELAYSGLAAPVRAVGSFPTMQKVGQAFSLEKQFPGLSHQLNRVFNNKYNYYANQTQRQIADMFKGVTENQMGDIMRSINMPSAENRARLVGTTLEDGRSLGDVRNQVQEMLGRLDTIESSRTMTPNGENLFDPNGPAHRSPTQFVSNHVPFYFPNEEYNGTLYDKFMRMNTKRIADTGTAMTHAEVNAMGLHPEGNLQAIMMHRAKSAYGHAARSMINNEAIDRYGTEIFGGALDRNNEQLLKAAKENDLVPAHESLLRNTKHAGKDMYIPRQLNESLLEAQKLYDKPAESKAFWSLWDKALRGWKSSVTTYNPRHHLSNMLGDAMFNWMAGVKDPRAYADAVKTWGRKEGGIMLNGKKIGYDELMDAYINHGGMGGFTRSEILNKPFEPVHANIPGRQVQFGEGFAQKAHDIAGRIGESAVGQKVGDVASTINQGVDRFADARENYGRLANFTNSIKEYARNTKGFDLANPDHLNKAFEYAANKVRKFNLDYGNVTRFETMLRRGVPFYTFTRQAAPLFAQMMIQHPDIMSRFPKYQRTLSTLLGVDPNQSPMSEFVPKYIQDAMDIRVQGDQRTNFLGKLVGSNNPLYADPTLPIQSILNLFNGIPGTGTGGPKELERTFLNQTVLRPIVEGGTGRSTLTGGPIKSTTPGYFSGQLPSLLRTLVGETPGVKSLPGIKELNPPAAAADRKSLLLQNLNAISPVTLRELTPTVQRGEVKRQTDILTGRIKARKAKLSKK